MTLPNIDRAVIEPAKVRDYLLSSRHPVGRFKAAFFRTLGYRASSWRALERDLRSQHLATELAAAVQTDFGMKYIVRANLTGPFGRAAALVSVWIVLTDEDYPRFVTAYPGESA